MKTPKCPECQVDLVRVDDDWTCPVGDLDHVQWGAFCGDCGALNDSVDSLLCTRCDIERMADAADAWLGDR